MSDNKYSTGVEDMFSKYGQKQQQIEFDEDQYQKILGEVGCDGDGDQGNDEDSILKELGLNKTPKQMCLEIQDKILSVK